MSLLDTLNPFKVKWWKKSEWHRKEKHLCVKIVEENGSSWDVETTKVVHYKHKETGEDRLREDHIHPSISRTVFEDPREE